MKNLRRVLFILVLSPRRKVNGGSVFFNLPFFFLLISLLSFLSPPPPTQLNFYSFLNSFLRKVGLSNIPLKMLTLSSAHVNLNASAAWCDSRTLRSLYKMASSFPELQRNPLDVCHFDKKKKGKREVNKKIRYTSSAEIGVVLPNWNSQTDGFLFDGENVWTREIEKHNSWQRDTACAITIQRSPNSTSQSLLEKIFGSPVGIAAITK